MVVVPTQATVAAGWVTVAKNDTPIVAYPPGHQSAKKTYRKNDVSSGRQYLTVWKGTNSVLNRSELYFFSLEGTGKIWVNAAEIVSTANSFTYFKNDTLPVIDEGIIWNGYGQTQYLVTEKAGRSCVAFQRYWGTSSIHYGNIAGTNRLVGYYCFNDKRSLSKDLIEELTNSFGIDDPQQSPTKTTSFVKDSANQNSNSLRQVTKPSSALEPRSEPAKSENVQSKSPSEQFKSLTLSISWEGIGQDIEGSVDINGDSGNGDLSLKLPGGVDACKGSWNFAYGAATRKSPAFGTWAFSCSNGDAGSGTYSGVKQNVGLGKGRDAEGHVIAFSYNIVE
jgi:hypothetical protein